MKMDFHKSLNFSFGNEDWNVEKAALQAESGDKALCVTASGDRPLHLLLTPCQKVVAVDVNQSQTALLELKMLIFDRFDYEKSLAFLGCNNTSHRITLYNEIKSDLSANARVFWDYHQKKIKQGVIYQGRTEKLCQFAAKILNFTRKEKNMKLFSFDNIEEQRTYVNSNWDSWSFRKLFEVAFHPAIFKLLSNDPGITAYTEYTANPGQYLYVRMLNYLRCHLARKSALLQLIFTGTVNSEAYLPYLTYNGYEIIRKRLALIEFHTDNIVEFLRKTPAKSFNCFSMSDIASYISQTAFEKLLNGINATAVPNARFCIRELFSKRQIPEELSDSFKREPALEKQLEQEESNFVYRFMVGKIAKLQ